VPEEFLECVICGKKEVVNDPWAVRMLGLASSAYGVKRCPGCDIRWLSPRPTEEEYKEMYKGKDYFSGDLVPEDYEIVVQRRIKYYMKRCEKIKKVVGKGSFRLLDMGAATGEFVNVARNRGIDAEGVETSEWGCKTARQKYGIDLICGDLFSSRLPDSSFDVLHMNHVFEHIPNPLAFLHRVSRILKRDGLLVMEVPYQFDNVFEKIRNFMGQPKIKEFSLFSIHHPFFYSPRSLGSILKKCGFQVLTMTTFDRDNPTSELELTYSLTELVKIATLSVANFFDKGTFIEVYAGKA
jgi:predicted SAM-dependent methyltransferase